MFGSVNTMDQICLVHGIYHNRSSWRRRGHGINFFHATEVHCASEIIEVRNCDTLENTFISSLSRSFQF